MRFIDKENTPNDWTSQRISHYVEEHKGGAPLKPNDFSESGFPVIPKKAIQQGNKLVITAPTFCTKSFADKNTRSIVDTNYTITTLRDLVPTGPTIGTVVNFYSDEQYILSQGVYGLKLKSNIDRDYFAYASNAPFYRKVMKRVMVGSTQVHIRTPEYLSLEIQLPPLSEQRKIAKILSTWDKAISTTERLIDNSKQQKKALMQQLLTGKKRLLDDSGKPFEGEWEEIKFGDCINHIGGTALEKHVSEDATHHFISIGNYSMDGKYVDKGQRVALNEKTSAKLLQKGELVMVLNDKTKTGDIIGSTILIDEDNKYIYNQRSERIIPKRDVHIIFFWFLLNSSKFRADVFNRSQGGTQIYINFSSVKTIQIKLPSILEQQKIATVLTNSDSEIELLEQQLAELKQEKKALMQQLLTGKRRVAV